MISGAADALPETATKEDYIHVLLETDAQRKDHPMRKAKSAVRQEASIQL
jgi:hypothetical protein